MPPSVLPSLKRPQAGFTIVEALVALVILLIFAVSSTVTLNLFNDRAAKNRNTEAARALLDDYINYVLTDNVTVSTATVDNGDLDASGKPLGAVCTALGTRFVPEGATATTATGLVPLIVARNITADPVVNGKLYWRVQPVGTAYGLVKSTDLMQVQFTVVYTYRGKTYSHQVLTLKANS